MQNPEVLQSNVGAVAGEPVRVFEPIARQLEKGLRAGRRVRIVVYVHGGGNCAVCDAAISAAYEAVRELGIERATGVTVRSWRLFGWALLLTKGIRRAPVLAVSGTVFSQGVVPDKEALKAYLKERIGA